MILLTCESLNKMTGRLMKSLIMQISSSSSHKWSYLELGGVQAQPPFTAPYAGKPWLQLHAKMILGLYIPFKQQQNRKMLRHKCEWSSSAMIKRKHRLFSAGIVHLGNIFKNITGMNVLQTRCLMSCLLSCWFVSKYGWMLTLPILQHGLVS